MLKKLDPFLFFEFDASFFQKYYGSGVNTPGIYAIPEDEVEPATPPEEPPVNSIENDDTEIEQRDQNREQLYQAINTGSDIEPPQLDQDAQQAYEQEVQPVKKIYLLNKLQKLQKILQKNSLANDDLSLVLKFGPYLTYNSLLMLTISAINNLKQIIPDQDKSQQLDVNNIPQQSVQPDNGSNMVDQGANINVAT